MTYEETISHLHGWIGRGVTVGVRPGGGEASGPVAGMAGLLRRADEVPSWVTLDARSAQDESLSFIVGDDENWRRNYFVLSRSEFRDAELMSGPVSDEMLVVKLRQAIDVVVSPIPSEDTLDELKRRLGDHEQS